MSSAPRWDLRTPLLGYHNIIYLKITFRQKTCTFHRLPLATDGYSPILILYRDNSDFLVVQAFSDPNLFDPRWCEAVLYEVDRIVCIFHDLHIPLYHVSKHLDPLTMFADGQSGVPGLHYLDDAISLVVEDTIGGHGAGDVLKEGDVSHLVPRQLYLLGHLQSSCSKAMLRLPVLTIFGFGH